MTYGAPFLMKTFGVTLVWSRIWGVLLGIADDDRAGQHRARLVALHRHRFTRGGFAHQTISVLVNTLSADLFDSREVGTVSGFAGVAAWTGDLGFSLLVVHSRTLWATVRSLALLGVFDLLGAAAQIVLIGGERHS